jgi:hypothetical protein
MAILELGVRISLLESRVQGHIGREAGEGWATLKPTGKSVTLIIYELAVNERHCIFGASLLLSHRYPQTVKKK